MVSFLRSSSTRSSTISWFSLRVFLVLIRDFFKVTQRYYLKQFIDFQVDVVVFELTELVFICRRQRGCLMHSELSDESVSSGSCTLKVSATSSGGVIVT